MSIIRPPYTGDPVLDSWTNQITQYLNIGLLPGVNTPSGSDGAGANGNTTIYLYQKTASATAPAAPTSVSYDYSDLDDVTVTANNGWTGAVPGTTLKYLWVTFRYVSKLVDTITNSNTWNTPVLLASNGDDGNPGGQGPTGPAGLNNATVLLHNKNSSSSAPSLFSGTFTYTFSTGALSGGSLNGWTQTAPSLSIGEFLFSSSAIASATTTTDTVASSEFSTPQVTGSSGTNGTNGTNGDVSRTLYLYDASINQPSAIANNAGFNSSTGNASNTGTWTTTVPNVGSGQGLWVASANITRTNNAGSFVGGGWTIYRASGNAGANGPKFATKRLYKSAVAGSQGSAPSATLTWSTGALAGITSGWSLIPNVQQASSTTLVWSSDLFFIDTSGFAGASNATGSTPVQSTSFSGLVTFSSGDFTLDGNTITAIDGGNITTNSIKTNQIDIDGNLRLSGSDSGFIAGRVSSSAYNTDGFFVGREIRPTIIAAGSMSVGVEYRIYAVGSSQFTSTGASSNTVGTVFRNTQGVLSGSGQVQEIGFEVSHTSVDSQIHGIIHAEDTGLQILNPTLISGGSASGGTSTISTVTSVNSGDAGASITITAYGGGGAGGFGRDDGYLDQSISLNNSGGTTTAQVWAGVPGASGSVQIGSSISAAGGLGGRNALLGTPWSGAVGQASEFGGAGSGAPSQRQSGSAATGFSSGGGGAGGDQDQILDSSGGAGMGGLAGQKVTQVFDTSSYIGLKQIYVKVTAIGAGATPTLTGNGTGNGDFIGGAGGAGAVQFSSILGGTQQYTVGDIALGSGRWRQIANGTYNTTAHYQNLKGTAMFISYTNFSGGMQMSTGVNINSYVEVNFNDGDSDNDGRSVWMIPNKHYYRFARLNSIHSYTGILECW